MPLHVNASALTLTSTALRPAFRAFSTYLPQRDVESASFGRPTYLPTDPAAPETRRPTYLPPEGVTVGNGHVTAEFFAARLWRGAHVTAENENWSAGSENHS